MDTIKNTAKTFIKGLFNPDNKLSLIPNWLSFSRVIGGLAIPVMAYTKAPLPFLLSSVTFLAVSDFLDGKAARIIAKEETKEGAMLDAISDKIFSILLIIGIIPILPIFAINGILEAAIALINSKLLSKGGTPKSNLLGKVKIWPLSIALILGYIALAIQNLNIPNITNETLLTISTILSLGTIPLETINIKQYFNEYKRQINEINNQQNNTHPQNEITQTKNNTQNNTKKPKFTLSKKNHPAIVYEITDTEKTLNEIDKNEKQKTYTKKNKH